MKQSKLFSLNWQDAAKGLIMAVLGGVVSVLTQSINSGEFKVTLVALWHGALVGGVAYIGKNFFTPQQPTKEVTKTDDGIVTKTVISTDRVDVKVNPN